MLEESGELVRSLAIRRYKAGVVLGSECREFSAETANASTSCSLSLDVLERYLGVLSCVLLERIQVPVWYGFWIGRVFYTRRLTVPASFNIPLGWGKRRGIFSVSDARRFSGAFGAVRRSYGRITAVPIYGCLK